MNRDKGESYLNCVYKTSDLLHIFSHLSAVQYSCRLDQNNDSNESRDNHSFFTNSLLSLYSSFFLLFTFSPISQHLPTLFLHFFYSFSYLINILTFQYSIYNLSTLSQHILNIFFEMFMNFLSLVLKFLNIFCDTVNDSKILSEKNSMIQLLHFLFTSLTFLIINLCHLTEMQLLN